MRFAKFKRKLEKEFEGELVVESAIDGTNKLSLFVSGEDAALVVLREIDTISTSAYEKLIERIRFFLVHYLHAARLQEDQSGSPTDSQVGGTHYKNKGIQPIDYITSNKMSYSEGCVIKYITRYKEKNGIEDLEKAKHYIDFLIADMEESDD